MLIFAIIFISMALIFYSIGVWAERIQGTLKGWHVVVFWFGLVCDTTGTKLMSTLVTHQGSFNIHAITGVFAIALMLFHAIWATVVVLKKKEKSLKTFHNFSFVVWLIWLIPYVSGLIVGMSR